VTSRTAALPLSYAERGLIFNGWIIQFAHIRRGDTPHAYTCACASEIPDRVQCR
jgi:hypothetical protein